MIHKSIAGEGNAHAAQSSKTHCGRDDGRPHRKRFSGQRIVQAPPLVLPEALTPNVRLEMDGLEFLSLLPSGALSVAFLDPQYRGVLEKLFYGNEGKRRGRRCCALEQMPEDTIFSYSSDGLKTPGIDKASRLARAAGVWLDWLATGEGTMWTDKFPSAGAFMHG